MNNAGAQKLGRLVGAGIVVLLLPLGLTLIAMVAPHPFEDQYLFSLFFDLLLLPAVFGWYAKRHCRVGEAVLLASALLIPLVSIAIGRVVFHNPLRLSLQLGIVVPWLFVAALGYRFG